jgi:hypothetical protein
LDFMIEFIGLVTTVHKSLPDTLSFSSDWTLHGNSSDFQLNSVVLRCTSLYSFSSESESESESYVTTDGQPASLSWNKAHIWGLRPDLCYCQTVAGLFMWGALSDERTGLSFITAAGPRQRSHSRVRGPWHS